MSRRSASRSTACVAWLTALLSATCSASGSAIPSVAADRTSTMSSPSKVTAYIGAGEYGGHFPIDLSLNQRAAEPIDWLQPRPVIELPGSDPLPRFALYPLAEQVADKICAMFATYRGAPSSRYRDLVDLVFIITGQELDASRTINALRGEAVRRQVDLPAELVSPGAGWDQGYRTAAAETSLSAELHTLDAALEFVGTCLAPLLNGLRTVGTWNPNSSQWLG